MKIVDILVNENKLHSDIFEQMLVLDECSQGSMYARLIFVFVLLLCIDHCVQLVFLVCVDATHSCYMLAIFVKSMGMLLTYKLQIRHHHCQLNADHSKRQRVQVQWLQLSNSA